MTVASEQLIEVTDKYVAVDQDVTEKQHAEKPDLPLRLRYLLTCCGDHRWLRLHLSILFPCRHCSPWTSLRAAMSADKYVAVDQDVTEKRHAEKRDLPLRLRCLLTRCGDHRWPRPHLSILFPCRHCSLWISMRAAMSDAQVLLGLFVQCCSPWYFQLCHRF